MYLVVCIYSARMRALCFPLLCMRESITHAMATQWSTMAQMRGPGYHKSYFIRVAVRAALPFVVAG